MLSLSGFQATFRHDLVEDFRSLTGHELLVLGLLSLVFSELYILDVGGYLLLHLFVLLLVLDFSLLQLFRRLLGFDCGVLFLVYDLDELLFGSFGLSDGFELDLLGQFHSLRSILFGVLLLLSLKLFLLSLPLFRRFLHFLGNHLLLLFLLHLVLNEHFLENYFGFFELLLFFLLLLLGGQQGFVLRLFVLLPQKAGLRLLLLLLRQLGGALLILLDGVAEIDVLAQLEIIRIDRRLLLLLLKLQILLLLSYLLNGFI